MKWFRHDCDMHTDLKIQTLLEKHGLEGYAIWNICLEMVGKEGKKGKLEGQLRWRQLICKAIGWSDNDKFDEIISTMAELGLICSKSLKYGNLYIPKFIKRADDYTLRKLRTETEQYTDNIIVEKDRIDKIRMDYIKIKGFRFEDFSHNDFNRTAKAIKTLLIKAKLNDELVIKSFNWASQKDWCDWTLETIIKKWADFIKEQGKIKEEPKLEKLQSINEEERKKVSALIHETVEKMAKRKPK